MCSIKFILKKNMVLQHFNTYVKYASQKPEMGKIE